MKTPLMGRSMPTSQKSVLGVREDFLLCLFTADLFADLSKFFTGISLLLKAVNALSNKDVHWSKFQTHASEEVDKVMSTGGDAEGDNTAQNVSFNDAHPGYMDSRGEITDPLRQQLVDKDISLENFFKRPIRVATLDWDVGTQISTSFDPWSLYFEDKRVINRISNYKLMKANLHVKFMLNGNSFYFGRILVTYRPLPGLDQTTILVPNNFNDLVEASQRPHIYLNPTLSQGGEMMLPFFTPLNMLDIPSQEWRTMGQLDIETPSILKQANGGTTPVTISVFVWAENVEITGLTQQNPTNIVPQGKKEWDGIISKPASIVAKTAGMFKSVPYIGAFATATEIGANAISSMAALFGYSKPVTEDIPPLQPISRQSMANCDGRESLIKLTVDPCNELSIDPQIAALDIPDELTINSITNRETLLTKFDWAVSVAPESLLFNIIVDPCVIRQEGVGVNAPLHMPAMAFGTFPFEYWKGTLRYRFQAVASGFHKGRIKIVYDPFGQPQTGGVADEAEYNVAYTEIVDIAECNDFTIDVGWGQHTPFRQHLNFPQVPNSTFRGASGTTVALPLGLNSANLLGVGNGVLSVYVVNELTTPDSTINNDIEILVSVSACDDFEVAAPTDYYLRRLGLSPITTPQALRVPLDQLQVQGADEEVIGMENQVVDPETLRYMGSKTMVDPLINRIHMGETVVSYRQLLKRYILHETIAVPNGSAEGSLTRMTRRMFPFDPGYTSATIADSSLIEPIPTGNYAYARLTLLNYLKQAYGAWRGSIRYTIDCSFNEQVTNTFQEISSNHLSTWSYSRIGVGVLPAAETIDDDEQILPNLSFSVDVGQNRYVSLLAHQNSMGLSGATRWNTNVNPIQSFEVPYYSRFRFAPGRQRTIWTGTDQYQDSFELISASVGSPGPTLAFKYVAAGEDFTFMFYLSPPIFYAQDLPPNS